MSAYTPAEHAHCHVCGHWTRLTTKGRLLYRHRYGGAAGSDYCIGGRHKVGQVVVGYTGPYVRDPRPWWRKDWNHGYRAHLPHPYSCAQGSSGCDVCGGHRDRKIHDETPEHPYQRITEAEYLAEKAEKSGEGPKPQFTDTSFAARQARMDELKQPAVSTSLRGDSGSGTLAVVAPNGDAARRAWKQVMFPHHYGTPNPTITIPQEATMNLNIQTTQGTARKHRATISSADGTQGVFCESDDLSTAIAQATSAVLSGASAATFAGVALQASQDFRGRAVSDPDSIRELFKHAIEAQEYVKVRYRDSEGNVSIRTVFPLRVTATGLAVECRNTVSASRGFRRLLFSRISTAEIED